MVAGREVTPKDMQNTDRLKRYWTVGEGAAKIDWGAPGDFDRCVVELGKYMQLEEAHGYCAERHHEVLGIWPATHAKLVREGDGEAAVRRAGRR